MGPATSLFDASDATLSYREDGTVTGPTVVFAHALGTDMSMWDTVLPHLPSGLRLISYDIRGHGGSSVPRPPYTMGALIRDTERLFDHLNVRGAVFVGSSIGGLIAQGLAMKRLDQVRALVLCNTAAKIDNRVIWQKRIDAVRSKGMAANVDDVIARWFSKDYQRHGDVDHWRHHLLALSEDGYIGCAEAISGTDFYTPTSALRLPVLGISGSEDRMTPPDLVQETVKLIPGSKHHLMRRVGHLPSIEQPKHFAELLTAFIEDIGHV